MQYLISILMVLLFTISASAQVLMLKGSWEFTPKPDEVITGFIVYDSDHNVVVTIPDPAARSFTQNYDFGTKKDVSMYVKAYVTEPDGTRYSEPSNIDTFTVTPPPVTSPGKTFIIVPIVVPN